MLVIAALSEIYQRAWTKFVFVASILLFSQLVSGSIISRNHRLAEKQGRLAMVFHVIRIILVNAAKQHVLSVYLRLLQIS